jgi:Desulfoferrodoxin, N-terminal domain
MTEQSSSEGNIATGTRLRCATCMSEVIVIRAGAAEMTCCGSPLETIFAGGRSSGT